MKERFVGIDIGKRKMVVRFVDSKSKSLKKWEGSTNPKGRCKFASQLAPTDVIGIEAGALSFVLARELKEKVGCKVHVLNPGRLHMIFKSVRKTDSEDAMKIARFIASNAEEVLPIVSIPTEQEEECRAIVSEMMFAHQSRTRLINRLHSIFVRAGITGITKAILKDPASRDSVVLKLSDYKKDEALRLVFHINNLEVDIRELTEKEKSLLVGWEEAFILFSIPGVAIKTAMAFLGHIGHGDRFSSGSQVSNYIGVVPKLDCSGDKVIYGRIHKNGNSTLRALYIQSAWALVRSKAGGELKKKYQKLAEKIGNKKAIVAIARKMLELSWTLVQKKELYRYTSEEDLKKKLRYYKLENLAKTA